MEMINFHISHWHLHKMIQMTRVNHINCTREWLSSSNEITYLTAMKHAFVKAHIWYLLGKSYFYTLFKKRVSL